MSGWASPTRWLAQALAGCLGTAAAVVYWNTDDIRVPFIDRSIGVVTSFVYKTWPRQRVDETKLGEALPKAIKGELRGADFQLLVLPFPERLLDGEAARDQLAKFGDAVPAARSDAQFAQRFSLSASFGHLLDELANKPQSCPKASMVAGAKSNYRYAGFRDVRNRAVYQFSPDLKELSVDGPEQVVVLGTGSGLKVASQTNGATENITVGTYDVRVVGLSVVSVSPGGWFTQSIMERCIPALLKQKGFPYADYFGRDGLLRYRVRRIILSRDVSYTLRLTPSELKTVDDAIKAGGTLSIGRATLQSYEPLSSNRGQSVVRVRDPKGQLFVIGVVAQRMP